MPEKRKKYLQHNDSSKQSFVLIWECQNNCNYGSFEHVDSSQWVEEQSQKSVREHNNQRYNGQSLWSIVVILEPILIGSLTVGKLRHWEEDKIHGEELESCNDGLFGDSGHPGLLPTGQLIDQCPNDKCYDSPDSNIDKQPSKWETSISKVVAIHVHKFERNWCLVLHVVIWNYTIEYVRQESGQCERPTEIELGQQSTHQVLHEGEIENWLSEN